MGKRNVSSDANDMTVTRWLCLRANGATRITSTAPGLAADEISMELKIKVPKSLFKKPRLMAEITVPAGHAEQVKIPPALIDNISKQVKQAIGFEVVVVSS